MLQGSSVFFWWKPSKVLLWRLLSLWSDVLYCGISWGLQWVRFFLSPSLSRCVSGGCRRSLPADVIECSRPGLKGALCWQLVAGATPHASDTHTHAHRATERERGREREEWHYFVLAAAHSTDTSACLARASNEIHTFGCIRFISAWRWEYPGRKTRWSFSEQRVCNRRRDGGARSTFPFEFELEVEWERGLTTVGGTCVRKAFTCWLPIIPCAYRPMPFFFFVLFPPFLWMIPFLSCYLNAEGKQLSDFGYHQGKTYFGSRKWKKANENVGDLPEIGGV